MQKDPLVDDNLRSESEKIDEVLKSIGAEKAITIYLKKIEGKHEVLRSSMFNCLGWNDSFGLVEAWRDDAHAHRVAQNNHYHLMSFIRSPSFKDLIEKIAKDLNKEDFCANSKD